MQPQDAIVGQVLQGTYRVERVLGHGGMGAVYEASHLRLPRRFAVKLLHREIAEHPEALARFRREAQVTSAIGNPHILEVLDFNETEDGAPYIVMEYLEGEDLAARLAQRGRLTLPEAASILRQAASALQAAHAQGVIHRDLKPQNIFLCQRGNRDDFVKLLDFGISKVLGSSSVITRVNSLIGTPLYMSPEQAEDKPSSVDHRADIYAMATIMFEALAGAPPFTASSLPSLLYKIAHHAPPALRSLAPDVPPAVEQVIAHAMNKKRDDRPQDIEQLWQLFAEAAADAAAAYEEPTEDRAEDWSVSQVRRRTASAARASREREPSQPAVSPTVAQSRVSRAAVRTAAGMQGTTLSAANGETLAVPEPRPGSRGGRLLVLGLALVLGAGVTLLVLRPPGRDTAAAGKTASAGAGQQVLLRPAIAVQRDAAAAVAQPADTGLDAGQPRDRAPDEGQQPVRTVQSTPRSGRTPKARTPKTTVRTKKADSQPSGKQPRKGWILSPEI